jgi:tRNA-binding EMAP/Myf-like protein
MVGKELRHIASGLQGHYTADQLPGLVIVMANLKPRPLGGFDSNGMILCASDKGQTTFDILRPEGFVGERLYL